MNRSLNSGKGHLLWLGAGLLASASWFLNDVRNEENLWVFFGAIGVVVEMLSRTTKTAGQQWFDWPTRFVALSLAVLVVAIAEPSAALIPLAVLFLVPLAPLLVRIYRGAPGGCALFFDSACLSSLIVVQLWLLEYCHDAFLWFHFDMHLFDRLLLPIVALFGDSAVLDPTGVTIFDGRSSFAIHYSFARTHLIWGIRCLLLWSLLHAVIFTRAPCLRGFLKTATLALGVCLVWIAASLSVWSYTKQAGIFLNRNFYVLTETTGVVLMLPFIARAELDSRRQSILAFRRASLAGAFALFAVALLTLFAFWYPAGQPKSVTRILIDDAHSPWERSTVPFGFSDEGMTKEAAYSYTNFADLLGHYYRVDVNTDKRLNEIDLSRYGVLILKTPTEPYTDEEIESVMSFTKSGGGLFVHGDHTNLFGMSTYLNALLASAGVQFNLDDQATFSGAPSEHSRQSRFRTHPTMYGIDRFRFLTSCTLRPRSAFVEPVIASKRIFSEDARYGRPGFFGNMQLGAEDRVGCFLQAAVVPYGSGRIAVFSDSTVFSNFAFFKSGYPEYALRTVAYLQRTRSRVRDVLLLGASGLGVIAVIIVVWCWRRGQDVAVYSLLAFHLPIGFVVGAACSVCFSRTDVLSAKPIKPLKRVAIVLGEDATVHDSLTVEMISEDQRMRDFSSFVVACQRAGYLPKLVQNLRDGLRLSDRVIVINPTNQWDATDVTEIIRAVARDGTRVLVLDSLTNRESTAKELLQSFGLDIGVSVHSFDGHEILPAPLLDHVENLPQTLVALVRLAEHGGELPAPRSPRVPATRLKLVVGGGKVVDTDDARSPVFVRQDFESRGAVLAYVDSVNFSTFRLGGGFLRSLEPSQNEHTRAVQVLLQQMEQ